MLVVTIVAVLLGAMVGLPPELTLVLGKLISLSVFMTVLLGVIHGRGYLRTFCTGGLVAAAYYLLPDLISTRGGSEVMLAELANSLLQRQGQPGIPPEFSVGVLSLSSTLELLVSVVTLGSFSVWVRKRIERRQSQNRRPSGSPG